MVRGGMCGLMEGNMMVTGILVKWKGEENSNGMMEDHTLENIKTTKNMDMENFHGLMEENLKEIGLMGNNMERVYSSD